MEAHDGVPAFPDAGARAIPLPIPESSPSLLRTPGLGIPEPCPAKPWPSGLAIGVLAAVSRRPPLITRFSKTAPAPTGKRWGLPQPPLLARPLALLAPLLLSGCLGAMPVPMGALDRRLEAIGSSHSPALSDRWLALIGGRGGREQVVLVDLERQMPVPLPGLNRPDAQPLAVAVDASGERLAVVRQLEGRTELVLYRRSLMALEPVAMEPAGVPRRISLRADGRELAVEVSRGGVWQVDLIQVP